MSTLIDLSQLPAPDAIEELSVETIREEILDALAEIDPLLAGLSESDPGYHVAQICAYRETLIRARINDAIRDLLLSGARGTMLDHIGNAEDAPRLVTEDELGEQIEEGDEDYRARIQQVKRSRGAGVREAYESAALAADARVSDALARRESPAEATVEWVPAAGVDTDDHAEIGSAVTAAVTDSAVRALTDLVTVTRAEPVAWTVTAIIYVRPGPDPATVLGAAEGALVAFAAGVRRARHPVRLDAIYAALSVSGVVGVDVTVPPADVEMDGAEFPEFDPELVELATEVAPWLD